MTRNRSDPSIEPKADRPFDSYALVLKPKAFWRGEWEKEAADTVIRAFAAEAKKRGTKLVDVSMCSERCVVVCIGGDGSVLSGMRAAAPAKASVAGINLGKLGFLAPFDSKSPKTAAKAVFGGGVDHVNRSLARAVLPDGTTVLAANEITLSRSRFGKPSRFVFSVSGRAAGEFTADGLLVSTATGSTGYSLSVGGPPMDPASHSAIISMSAPMSLSARSLVVPWRLGISCKAFAPEGEPIVISADGIVVFEGPCPKDGVGVTFDTDAPTVKTLVPRGWSFYEAAKEKLGWGFVAGS